MSKSESETLVVWCLVQGDFLPFLVDASPTIRIDNLKKIIIEKLKLVLSPGDVILWKPTNDIPVYPFESLAGRIEKLGDLSRFAKNLDPVLLVADVFKKQTSTQRDVILNVIVRIATSESGTVLGKRAADDPEPSDIRWLEELYSHTWSKEGLRSELFRTVVVTREHYDQLQNTLNKEFPDRNGELYDGGRNDVLCYKLDLLASLTLASPHPNDTHREDDDDDDQVDDVDDDDKPEGKSEEDSQINSFFPFTLTYLDLSILKLKSQSDRFPMPIFIREEYSIMSKLINERPQSGRGSVIVTGQPGTGKTVYLYVRIIESLIAGCPFLYQTNDETSYLVDNHGVRLIQSRLSPENSHIVGFVDGDLGVCKPIYMNGKMVQVIVTSSPEILNQKWMNQTSNEKRFINLAVDLWSLRELFITGVFLYPWDISPKLLISSASYFGNNPRRCFDSAHSSECLELNILKVKAYIGRHATTAQILNLMRMFPHGPDDFSHLLFQLRPLNELRRVEECQFEAVSDWAYDLIMCVCATKDKDVATTIYYQLENMPSAGLFRDHLFEKHWRDFL